MSYSYLKRLKLKLSKPLAKYVSLASVNGTTSKLKFNLKKEDYLKCISDLSNLLDIKSINLTKSSSISFSEDKNSLKIPVCGAYLIPLFLKFFSSLETL